jgi:2-C-methyl-D-erythritol 4-phosphate cytidylyltransferase
MHSKDKPKQFLTIYGKPVIIHTLEHFENCPDIDAVSISCLEEWIPQLKDFLFQFRINKVKRIVPGGETGQMSIFNALVAAEEIVKETDDGNRSIALIHDGVRPLISPQLLTQNIECVRKYGSAITTGVVKETIVVVGKDGGIESIPKRSACRVAKAPESFWLDEIMQIQRKAISEGNTSFYDSCCLMNQYGYKLHMIEGPIENIKITTPDDIYTLRGYLEKKENAQLYGL